MKTEYRGMGLGTVLFIVFLVLKLTGTITWSWWWITAPLWIPIGIALIGLTVIGVITFLAINDNKNNN